jgi:hypothetical protein
VDATTINAPSSTKNARQERDLEMHQTREIGCPLPHAPSSSHVFAGMKLKFGFVKVRYRGLDKNAHRLFVTCALLNLFLVHKRLLCTTVA